MALFKLLIFAALAICSLCAPTLHSTKTRNCTLVTTAGDCADGLFVVIGVILIIVVLLCVGMCVTECPKSCRRRTACRHYTTSRDATADKVYKQLRRKWRAHEKEKDEHLRNSELPISFHLDDDQQNRMKKMMEDIKFYSAQCRKFFATKEYHGGVVPTTTDFSVHFAKECAAIENFAAKVEQMKRVLPTRPSSG